MEKKDVRWIQRYNNFLKTFHQFEKFIEKGDRLNELEQQGLIKSFEYTYELAWNTLKDFYELQGESGIQGSRDAIQMAFKRGLITDGDAWMAMLQDRNRTSHTYNEDIAKEITRAILSRYFACFVQLQTAFQNILNQP